ncbi:MAG: outer membrane beta-barrel protein, partial [Alphaproteobacteria bacterium]|nr:outer membrane beta-barrel protein [Alphaproteobacteria bacterium]
MRVKTLILATSAAGALALSAGAASADPNGWYGAIDAGYHTVEDLKMASQNPGPDFEFEVDNDWAGFARLGYRFTPNWRVELEGGYRQGELGAVINPDGFVPWGICNVTPAAGDCNAPDGEVTATTLMVNVLYDFGSANSTVRPFLGLGAGAARINTEFVGTFSGARTTVVAADDSSLELAAQAIAGVAWALSDRASLDVTYRYLATNMEFDSSVSVPGHIIEHTCASRWKFIDVACEEIGK